MDMTPKQRDTVQLIHDEADRLAAAYRRADQAAAATALATLAQEVHLSLLASDPYNETPAALTHVNGRYVGRVNATNN